MARPLLVPFVVSLASPIIFPVSLALAVQLLLCHLRLHLLIHWLHGLLQEVFLLLENMRFGHPLHSLQPCRQSVLYTPAS